jgi:hypothetical protein
VPGDGVEPALQALKAKRGANLGEATNSDPGGPSSFDLAGSSQRTDQSEPGHIGKQRSEESRRIGFVQRLAP